MPWARSRYLWRSWLEVNAFRIAALTALVSLMLSASVSDAGDDVQRGEQIYGRCLACHALERNRTGPKHCGLFGRRAGSVPGFEYSKAMRRSGIVWDEATLDAFLSHPMRAVPGTTMGYAGIESPQERSDLIAYLRSASASAAHCR